MNCYKHRVYKLLDGQQYLMDIAYIVENHISNEINYPEVVLTGFSMHNITDDIVGPNIVDKDIQELEPECIDNIINILERDGVLQDIIDTLDI